jgi:hypothetical protein
MMAYRKRKTANIDGDVIASVIDRRQVAAR